MTMTMTSTVAMPQQTSAIMLPASPAELDGNNRVVRFDSECVLIPEPSRRPKPSKTYSLPLWKKRPSDSETEATSSSSRASLSPEETHVVFKVPIPRFISRSPSRGRSTSASPPTPKPLSPCLVYRTPSSLPSPTTPKPIRRTSLPASRPKDDAALTVPLRACCADCVPITEECLKEGEQWQEKFSRGARRRRSASLDNGDNLSRGSDPSSGSTYHTLGFAAVAANAHGADIGPSSNPRYRTTTFAITVDEVDKRRKSQEYTEEELRRFSSSSSSPRPTPAFHSPTGPFSASSYPLTYRAPEREASTSSTSSSVSELSPNDIPARRPKSSPIQEEDEDQLFPLPSPRRSPNNSPSPSKSSSPAPSPNASTSCLPAAAASKDSLSQGSSTSDDVVLAKSLSRKPPSGNGHLSPTSLQPAPSTSPSMLTTTAPGHVHSATPPEASERESPPKPQLLPLTIPSPPHPRPARPLPSPSLGNGSLPTSPVISKLRPLPVPPSPRSPTMTSHPASSPSATSGAATPSASRSPPSSPSVPTKTRRPSFSLPAIKDALKGAGVDVLKGVSSMGGGGVVGSV